MQLSVNMYSDKLEHNKLHDDMELSRSNRIFTVKECLIYCLLLCYGLP